MPFTPANARAFETIHALPVIEVANGTARLKSTKPRVLKRQPSAVIMHDVYKHRRKGFCERLRGSATSAQQLRVAIVAGLSLGAVSYDPTAMLTPALTRDADPRTSSSALQQALQQAFVKVVQLHTGAMPSMAGLPRATHPSERSLHLARAEERNLRLARAFWELDVPQRHAPAALLADALGSDADGVGRRAAEMYARLSRDGFVRFESWPGLDAERIARVAMDALDVRESWLQSHNKNAYRSGHVIGAWDEELAALLRPLVRDEALARAVGAYMHPARAAAARRHTSSGAPGPAPPPAVCTYGATIRRFREQVWPYENDLWHHDRVGRRLKLFLLLHDVDETHGRPTLVTNGTHRAVYYSVDDGVQFDSRFDERWVRTQHQVVSMHGRLGSLYLFDTNAIHGPNLNGTRARSVLSIEFDRPGRCKELYALKSAHWESGAGGAGHFPFHHRVSCASRDIHPIVVEGASGIGPCK